MSDQISTCISTAPRLAGAQGRTGSPSDRGARPGTGARASALRRRPTRPTAVACAALGRHRRRRPGPRCRTAACRRRRSRPRPRGPRRRARGRRRRRGRRCRGRRRRVVGPVSSTATAAPSGGALATTGPSAPVSAASVVGAGGRRGGVGGRRRRSPSSERRRRRRGRRRRRSRTRGRRPCCSRRSCSGSTAPSTSLPVGREAQREHVAVERPRPGRRSRGRRGCRRRRSRGRPGRWPWPARRRWSARRGRRPRARRPRPSWSLSRRPGSVPARCSVALSSPSRSRVLGGVGEAVAVGVGALGVRVRPVLGEVRQAVAVGVGRRGVHVEALLPRAGQLRRAGSSWPRRWRAAASAARAAASARGTRGAGGGMCRCHRCPRHGRCTRPRCRPDARPTRASSVLGSRQLDAVLGRPARTTGSDVALALELARRVAVDVGRRAHLGRVPQAARLVDALEPRHAGEELRDRGSRRTRCRARAAGGAPLASSDAGAAEQHALQRPATVDALDVARQLALVEHLRHATVEEA